MMQWRVGRHPGLEAWRERLDAAVAEAAAAGAQLLLMPEYAPMEMATGRLPDVVAELARAVELAPAALEAAREVARRHGVFLLPGTLPWAQDGRIHNRAPLISASGAVAWQDKHVMTRFEVEEWDVSPGVPPVVFATPWGRIGVAVCFDCEFPGLVRAQVEAGAWLILVPTCTDTMHGFNRVRLAARARGLENQCFVAISPTVGVSPWCAALDDNHGYAALFGPVDHGFPDDGVIARGTLDVGGWVYVDLDASRLDAVRAAGAVRNHASWPADPPPCPVLELT